MYALGQWETTLHCNVVSQWLGAYTKWSLDHHYYFPSDDVANGVVWFQLASSQPGTTMYQEDSHRALEPLLFKIMAATDHCDVSLWTMGICLQASLVNSAHRLYNCDAIASLAPRVQQSWHSKPNVIYGDSLGPNTSWVSHMDWKHSYQTQWVCVRPLFNTIRAIAVIRSVVTMLNRFPETIFSGNIENLLVGIMTSGSGRMITSQP